MESRYWAVLLDDRERYKVADEASIDSVTSNLQDHELKMNCFKATDCPKQQHCVVLREVESDICTFIGPYPLPDSEGKLAFQNLHCGADHEEKEVIQINVIECPIARGNCIGCGFLKYVEIPPYTNPTKSHAHIVCGKLGI